MARYNQSIKETKGKTLDKKKVEYKGIPDPRQPITTVQPRRVVTQQTVQPVVQQAAEAQYVQSSISVIKNLPYLVNTSTTNYVKLFDSSIDLVLQDVLIINRSATEVAAVNILLSEFDIDTESGKNLNKQLQEGANHANGKSLQGKEDERQEKKRVFNEKKEEKKVE